MRVVFGVRNDFFDKPGGDTVQIKQYCANSCEGVEFEIITLKDFMVSPDGNIDIFILVNLDRFYELFEFYKLLLVLRIKFYIIPIHHGLTAMNDFYSFKFPLLSYFFGRGNEFFSIQRMKSIILMVLSCNLRNLFSLVFFDYRGNVLRVLNESSAVICLTELEARLLRCDYDFSSADKIFLLRNGVDNLFLEKVNSEFYTRGSASDRDIDVLVVGRIESRKNQLCIASQLSGKSFRVVFAGLRNPNEEGYFGEFLAAVKSSDNLEYIGAVSREELPSLYARSKVHLSASWFEVSSLVDIEAHTFGCFVVSSSQGGSYELLPTDAYLLFDPLLDRTRVDHVVSEAVHRAEKLEQSQSNIVSLDAWGTVTAKFCEYLVGGGRAS